MSLRRPARGLPAAGAPLDDDAAYTAFAANEKVIAALNANKEDRAESPSAWRVTYVVHVQPRTL